MHIAIDLEGVLRHELTDAPIPQGVQITGALSAYNQLTFLTDQQEPQAIRWLNENKVVDFDNVIDASVSLPDEDLRQRQLKVARAKGNVDLYITSSPAMWAFAFEQGIACLMFGVPSYLRAEFRPDAPKKVRAWNEIEQAVKKHNEIRTQDARLTRSEGVRFE